MRLLLVEDKDSFRRLLVQALEGTSWEVQAVGDPTAALAFLQACAFDVLVTDLRLPGFSGLELLQRAKRLQPGLRVLLMSAFGEPQDIVEAVHWGADDFLPKPFDLDRFQAVLDRLAALAEAPPPDPREPWVACSPAMRRIEEALVAAAPVRTPVLFAGGPGTGKARAARRLHVLHHPHAPFLALSAATLPPEGPNPLILEHLAGGSLYLSDLDNASPRLAQALAQAMDSPSGGAIRWMGGAQDLARVPETLRLRLGVLSLPLPPLAQRREDIIPLFRSILAATSRRMGRVQPVVDRPVERTLLERSWPGNVRELTQAVEAALADTQGALLAPLPVEAGEGPRLTLRLPDQGPLESRLEAVRKVAERVILSHELAAQRRDLGASAEILGLTPRALAQRLREHHISLEDES